MSEFKEKTSNKKTKSAAFATLKSFYWHNKKYAIPIDLLRLFSSALLSFIPLLIANLATSIDNKDRAFILIVLLFTVNAVHYVTWATADYLLAYKIIPKFSEFKKTAFNKIWTFPYADFVNKPSGKVGHYVNMLPKQLYFLYDAYNYGFLPTIAVIPVYMALLARSSWQVLIIYLIYAVIIGVVCKILINRMIKSYAELTDVVAVGSGHVFDSFANFVNVFSFRSYKKEIQRNNIDVDDIIKHNVKASLATANYWKIASGVTRIFLWSSIFALSWYMYDTGKISFTGLILSITVLLDFTQLLWNVLHNMGVWFTNSSEFKEAYDYLYENQNIIKEEKTINKNPRFSANQPEIRMKNALKLENIYFAYPDSPKKVILNNINLTISKNEKIGIVGKSGEGKSTLIKILLGFYQPTQGEILVDSKPANQAVLSNLNAYVPQDTTLFQETIYYNIAYASHTTVTKEQVIDAAKQAQIHEFILELPEGYNTLVGERGIKLSLGQRQRIAIARAIIKKSDLLILDEATSSLDSLTETLVQESFEKIWKNKSVIAIAHRLSTLNKVDRIIVLEKGEIVEEGTKSELLQINGHFTKMWQEQKQGMI